MKTLLLLASVFFATAPVDGLSPREQEALLRTFHALPSSELGKHKLKEVLDDHRYLALDATEKIQPASFRHTTTLLVPRRHGSADEHTFFVRYGRSTNTKEATYGPFHWALVDLHQPVTASGVACGPKTCALGLVCCNESCGLCTPPGGACIEMVCGPQDAGAAVQ